LTHGRRSAEGARASGSIRGSATPRCTDVPPRNFRKSISENADATARLLPEHNSMRGGLAKSGEQYDISKIALKLE